MSINQTEPATVIALTAAIPGTRLTVASIEAAGEDSVRLKRMGICEGREIELLQAGDPLILCVVKCRLGLSRRLAAQILVHCPDSTEWHEPAVPAASG